MGFFSRITSTRITLFDILFLVLKIILVTNFCLYFGVILGLLVYVLLDWLVNKTISIIFKAEPLGFMDKNVFFDQTTNRCNIVAGLEFERFDIKAKFKDHFVNTLTTRYPRLRSKLIKVLDNYYWKEFTPEELKVQVDKCVQVRDDIT